MLHNDWSFQQQEFHWYHPTQGLSTCPPNPLRPTDKLLPDWMCPVPFLVLLGWESLLDRNQQCLQFVRQPFHWAYDFQENDKKSRHNDLVELIVQDLQVWWLVPKRLITSVAAQISSAFSYRANVSKISSCWKLMKIMLRIFLILWLEHKYIAGYFRILTLWDKPFIQVFY